MARGPQRKWCCVACRVCAAAGRSDPRTISGWHLDAREYLDEERDAWRPFEALADLSDEQLTVPVEAAHGWTGRRLMGHLLSGQEVALAVAIELAVSPRAHPAGGSSPRKCRRLARHSARPWNETSGPIAGSPPYQMSVLRSGVTCEP